jgi:tungstate transport system ATP-binding protein
MSVFASPSSPSALAPLASSQSLQPPSAPCAPTLPISPWLTLSGVDCEVDGFAVLRGLDLTLLANDRVALVGANGCGKTSLLKLIHGILAPARGRLHWSCPVPQAMLFQRPHMLNTTVLKHVALGLWAQGHTWSQAKVQAQSVLAQVDLAGHARQPAKTLSAGQQQRLALARAWALAPQMLLLDEPTSSLDPQAKLQVERLIGQWIAPPPTPECNPEPTLEQAALTPPRALVFASHNLGQVKRLATRVVYLERGQIRADLSVQAFFNHDLQSSHPQAHVFLKGEL